MGKKKNDAYISVAADYEYILRQEYECALRLVVARIENLRQQDNFFTTTSRIKTFSSVEEKCHRKGYELTTKSIRANIRDIAGIRIVTTFQDEIQKIVDMMKKTPGINVDEENDYVSEPKSNGYRSYHITVLVEIYYLGESKIIPVEVQIRDIAMNMWATIEHKVKYKHDSPNPEAEAMFLDLANTLNDFSEKAIKIRESTAIKPN